MFPAITTPTLTEYKGYLIDSQWLTVVKNIVARFEGSLLTELAHTKMATQLPRVDASRLLRAMEDCRRRGDSWQDAMDHPEPDE